MKTDEIEDLTAEDQTLGELLHSLKRVDAPINFDSQVMARIADGEPKSSTGWRAFPVPVYAASLAAVLLFGSLFILREFYWADPNVPAVANGRSERIAGNQSVLAHAEPQPPAANNMGVPVTGTNSQEVAGPAANEPIFNRRNKLMPGGGSMDSALEDANQVRPRGFDPNASRVERVNPNNGSSIPITLFLNAVGIEADFQGQELKVLSVHGFSPADKSGVKAGDIIESIGDTKITPTTSFGSRIQVKSLTVIRGGQSIRIKLSVQ